MFADQSLIVYCGKKVVHDLIVVIQMNAAELCLVSFHVGYFLMYTEILHNEFAILLK